jgi:hypothetical protein
MKEKVLVHTIAVKQGLRRPFSIRLPQDAKRITKVLATASFNTEVSPVGLLNSDFVHLAHSMVACEIGLGLAGKTGIFYRDYIRLLENNPLFMNVILMWKYVPDVQVSPEFSVHKPLQVSIPVTNHLLEGWYSDRLLKAEQKSFTYDLKVYLWVELEEKTTNQDSAPVLPKAVPPQTGDTYIEMNNLIMQVNK